MAGWTPDDDAYMEPTYSRRERLEERWNPGGPPSVGYSPPVRAILDQQEFRQVFGVSNEVLRRAEGVEVMVRREIDRQIVALTRTVAAGKRLSTRETVPAKVRLPWSTTILVEHPRTWWERLWRRPVRTSWVPVSGVVTGRFDAQVDVSHLPTFPDLQFPPEFGPVVWHSEVARPGAWTEDPDAEDVPPVYEPEHGRTRPHGYPWAEER